MLAVMVWFSAVTWPAVTVMVHRPWALPRAATANPPLTEEELPIGAVVSPDAFCGWIGWRLRSCRSPPLSPGRPCLLRPPYR